MIVNLEFVIKKRLSQIVFLYLRFIWWQFWNNDPKYIEYQFLYRKLAQYSYILKRKVELNTVCDIELATFFCDIFNQYVDCLIPMEIW